MAVNNMNNASQSVVSTDACPSSKKSGRALSKNTFEKWKRENDKAYQMMMTWLSCELDTNKEFVASL